MTPGGPGDISPEINFYTKSGEYGFLSNFYPSPFVIEGKSYATNEHYFQSQKATSEELREWIRLAPTPYAAMKAGRSLRDEKDEIKKDWADKKSHILAKFTQNPELMKKLLATGDAVLHEDSPTDLIWGKKGEDRLGKILMKVRLVLSVAPDIKVL